MSSSVSSVSIAIPDHRRTSSVKDSLDLPKHKVWTKQEFSARIIQTKYRQHLAQMQLKKYRERKKKLEEDLQRLEKAAFDKIVRSERERSEKEKAEQRKLIAQREKEKKRMKRMMSAAFDGENDEILSVLSEVRKADDKAGLDHGVIGKNLRDRHLLATVDCKDSHGNTPLSEAAAGGHIDTVRLLLNNGADPNTQGQYMRTPLYRAAFSGHSDVCKVLLEYGADPRMYAMDNNTPKYVSTIPSVVELMQNWDIKETNRLIEEFESRHEQLRTEDKARKAAEIQIVKGEVEEKRHEYDELQSKLNDAYIELEKKIYEDEHSMNIGYNKKQKILQRIQDLNSEIEKLKVKIDECGEDLTEIILKLLYMEADDDDIQRLPGLHLMVKELEKKIIMDEDDIIKKSEKWPIIIDGTNQATIYLKYREACYINALDSKDMDHEHIRKEIVKALRYGKPLVLDMMEVDMLKRCAKKFDSILEGLLDMIFDKSILNEEVYLQLVKDSDGTDFQRSKFNKVDKFKFIIVTTNHHPPNELTDRTFVIRIFVPLA